MIAELARRLWRGLVHPRRAAIPEAVKAAVWRRDRGKCVHCGERRRWLLQYGHRVAWAKGGDDSAANLMLECQRCNLARGAAVPFTHQVYRTAQWLAVGVVLAAMAGTVAALVHPAPAWMVTAWREVVR